MKFRERFFLLIIFSSIVFFLYSCGVDKKMLKKQSMLIITFGDSITLGVGRGVGHEETYTYYLESLLKKSGRNVRLLRSGITGETAEGAVNRVDDEIIKLKPDYVLIMYGTNDAFIDTCYDELDITPRLPIEDYRKNIYKIIKKLISNNIKPVLMTPILMGHFGCENLGIYKTKGTNFKLKQYADVIKQIAKENKIILVDNFYNWKKLQKKKVNIDVWLSDGVHPNREGNKFIAELIFRVLEKNI